MDTEPLSKGEQTRLQIIQAAHTLFLKQGYHGTSMREIAREADIALGGIYNHFATKEEIFQAVFFAHHPVHQVYPAVMQARGDTTEELLRDIAHYMVEGLKKQPDFINLLFIDIVEFQGRNASHVIEDKMPFLGGIYQRLIECGGPHLRPDIPPLIFLRSFFGLFFSYYMTGIVLNMTPNAPPEISENAFEYFVDIYLHGAVSNENTSSPGARI
jgi:AcrR family transcriptional regulator